MKWSRLKKTVESGFAPCLGGRVELNCTVYRKFDGSLSVSFISVDKIKVCEFNDLLFFRHYDFYKKLESEGTLLQEHPSYDTSGLLMEPGELSSHAFLRACDDFMRMPVQEALRDTNPILQTLAILDKRIGKRTLFRIEKEKLERLPFFFYNLRTTDVIGSSNARPQ